MPVESASRRRSSGAHVHTLERAQRVDATPEELFAFFADATNLQRITPPWLSFEVLTAAPIVMRPGARIEYRLRLHGVPLRWLTEIAEWQPPRRFVDVQLRGPYRLWRHTHSFEPAGDGVLMRDVIRYALPLGALGELAHVAFVRRDVARIFEHRQRAIARAFAGGGPAGAGCDEPIAR